MSGQILLRRSGLFVPILGGGPAVADSRENLVPGTYFPDASTTGLMPGYTYDAAGIYQNGVLIPGSVLNGDQVYTGTDTLLENKLVNGRVILRGVRNRVKNCVIRGTTAGPPNGAGLGQALVQCDNLVQDAIIEDCKLIPNKPHYNWTGLYSHDFTALRCDISRVVDCGGMFRANLDTKAAFIGCYMHDLTLFNPDPNHASTDNRTHNDVIQIQGGYGGTILGNTLVGWLTNWPTGEGFVAATSDVTTNPPNVWAPPHRFSNSGNCVSTACIQVTPNVGTPKAVRDFVIRKNLIIGGATGINFANPSGSAVGSQGSCGVISDNFFDHWQGEQGSATSETGFTIRIGQAWSTPEIANNVYQDTLRPVTVRTGLVGN